MQSNSDDLVKANLSTARCDPPENSKVRGMHLFRLTLNRCIMRLSMAGGVDCVDLGEGGDERLQREETVAYGLIVALHQEGQRTNNANDTA